MEELLEKFWRNSEFVLENVFLGDIAESIFSSGGTFGVTHEYLYGGIFRGIYFVHSATFSKILSDNILARFTRQAVLNFAMKCWFYFRVQNWKLNSNDPKILARLWSVLTTFIAQTLVSVFGKFYFKFRILEAWPNFFVPTITVYRCFSNYIEFQKTKALGSLIFSKSVLFNVYLEDKC